MFRTFEEDVDRDPLLFFFFFNDTATTEIYTLSLHDALPISAVSSLSCASASSAAFSASGNCSMRKKPQTRRSEEHTSELQSHSDLVCRLLLEKKKKIKIYGIKCEELLYVLMHIISDYTTEAC